MISRFAGWAWEMVCGAVKEIVIGSVALSFVGTLMFMGAVRVWSLADDGEPSLRSFDPRQRIAAARAAAQKYGGGK